MKYILFLFLSTWLFSCGRKINMNEIEGRWTLVEIRRDGEDVIKVNEPSEHLSISKDRFYSIRYQFDTVRINEAQALDTIFSDTVYKGFDYYIKAEQLLLEDVAYLPASLKIEEEKIAYRDSQTIKILSGRSIIKVKHVSPTELVYSLNEMDLMNFVYRRLDDTAKVYTQQDLKIWVLKSWNNQNNN